MAVAEERDTRDGEIAPLLPSNASRGLLVSSLLVVAGQCRLLGFSVFNSNAATRYILLFDAPSAGVPANGAVPLMAWQVPSLSTLDISYTDPGRIFDRGCWIVNSTTSTTLTIGSADQLIDAQYV